MKTVETQEHTRHKDSGAAFHAVMREISIPLHRRHEIDVVSFGNSLHDPDCYYLIHAFDSAENMTAVLDAFYAGADWRNGPREDIIGSTETSIKTVMNLPPESVEGLRVQS